MKGILLKLKNNSFKVIFTLSICLLIRFIENKFKVEIFNSLLTIYYQTNYDKYVETYFALTENIRKEYSAINKYWSERIDIIGKIGQWYNDLFLKLNGNVDGTDDYVDKGDSEDSGTTDENDHPIYIINEYSPYQKVFIQEYLSKNNLN